VAVAFRNAAVPRDGKRPLGNSGGPADEAHGACAALPYREHLVAPHGFIKKSRATPDEDLALARKRKKELEQ
jgi:hypothetical protein